MDLSYVQQFKLTYVSGGIACLKYTVMYTFFGPGDSVEAAKYTRSILYTPVAKRRASKVGLCPTSACSIFFAKMDAFKTETGQPAAPLFMGFVDWIPACGSAGREE